MLVLTIRYMQPWMIIVVLSTCRLAWCYSSCVWTAKLGPMNQHIWLYGRLTDVFVTYYVGHAVVVAVTICDIANGFSNAHGTWFCEL